MHLPTEIQALLQISLGKQQRLSQSPRCAGERGRSASPLKRLFLMAARGEVAHSLGASVLPPEASTSVSGQQHSGASSPSLLIRSNHAEMDVSISLVETQTSSFYDAAEMRTASHQSSQLFYSMSESDMLDSVSAGTIISTTWTPMVRSCRPNTSLTTQPSPGYPLMLSCRVLSLIFCAL